MRVKVWTYGGGCERAKSVDMKNESCSGGCEKLVTVEDSNGQRVHLDKRSVSWVNNVVRQLVLYLSCMERG